MGYVHTNDLFQAIELSAKERVQRSKVLTVNSITTNRKRSYADACKASKNKDLKEGERKYIPTQNMQK